MEKKSVGVFFLSFSLAANRFFFRQSHLVFFNCVLTLVYYPQAEIKSVLDLGVCPERIIYANPCKQASHLKYACKKGVATMTFDNEVELYKVRPFMLSFPPPPPRPPPPPPPRPPPPSFTLLFTFHRSTGLGELRVRARCGCGELIGRGRCFFCGGFTSEEKTESCCCSSSPPSEVLERRRCSDII